MIDFLIGFATHAAAFVAGALAFGGKDRIAAIGEWVRTKLAAALAKKAP